ncbi:MAG: methionine aminotransferase [Saprospiraceae bacterium]|nr:methionine aminotransferase [Saprospiraceae bacterium]
MKRQPFRSKLPDVGTTIFTVMSALANEHKAINLSQGFPDFDCDEKLKELVADSMRQGKNQYPPMMGVKDLLDIIGRKVYQEHGRRLVPEEEITVTAGATQAIFTAICTVVRPGDEVIVIDPAYDCYRPSIQVNGGIPITIQLRAPDFKIDWNRLEDSVTPRTRLLIINTPQNPIGRIFKDSDLSALETLVKKHAFFVLSDEVYEHIVFDGQPHLSVLKYDSIYEVAFAVYSFGKTFHNTGWKIGYCIAPPMLTAEFRKVHQFNVFTVNTPMQYGIAAYLQNPETYRSLPAFFQKKRNHLQEAMKGSRLQPMKSEGTYFQLYDYSEISDLPDTEFAQLLTIDHGVASIPISVFYENAPSQDRIIRLCFAKQESTLTSAADRLINI